jgi:hypothetical protein
MELSLLISLAALVASTFALLVAVGSALRVQSLEGAASVERGLPPGTRVDHDALVPFVGQTDVAAWLRGPTLVVVAKTTCPSCHELVANMNRRSAELAPFRVLMIQRGHGDDESLEGTADFNAIWVKDASDHSKEVFRTNVSPHAFLIEQGRVVRQHSGAQAVTFLLGQFDSSTSKPAVATTI